MIIGFLGDVHGRVFHALAAVATWQVVTGRRFDLLIQVGDMGAFPQQDRMDPATLRYLAADPSEADFSRLLEPDNTRADALRHIRRQFAGPIYFIRGNHEDFAWLDQLTVDPSSKTARADPFDLFHYVLDGTVLNFGHLQIAFLGGAEEAGAGPAGIDEAAHRSLMQLAPGTIDVLVTHQGPYGLGVGYHGDVQGSNLMTGLVERLQPAFHIGGHRHQLDGPLVFGRTTYLGLAGLVASALWQPDARGLHPGCLAVLDSATSSLQPVTDPWLAAFDTPFDFDAWFEAFTSRTGA